MSSPLVSMDDAASVEQVGGKAASLAFLVKEGFDVPPFLVVTPDAFSENGLSATLSKQLLSRLAALGPGPYAARSSAREEDGADQSHAGQFLSLLSLGAQQVPASCFKVWNSGNAQSVAEYRASHGLDKDGGAPAVLVQQMVDARCAGVAFSADPVSGRRDRFVISAIKGLGEALVGGEEDGETYVLEAGTGALVDGPADGVLSPDDLTKLHDLIKRVQGVCGAAQDIEWAFEGTRLFLLQARPITTKLRPAPIADNHLMLFDNSNIVESYPGQVSPLTYSFAQYAYSRVYRAFVALLGVHPRRIQANAAVFDNMLTRIDTRVYYNLVNWYRALAMLPGFALNSSYMETMMGVSQPLPEEFLSTIDTPKLTGVALVREWLRVGKVGFRLCFEALRLKSTIRGFYGRLNVALEKPVTTLDEMSLTDLAAEYRRIEANLLDHWDAPLVNDFLCMMAFGASRKLLEKWGGAAGLEAHNDIMIGQGDIISAEPARRISMMAETLRGYEDLRAELARGDGSNLGQLPVLEMAVANYLEKFSDRCTEELKLESVPLNRDPAPLYMAIAAAALGPQAKAHPAQKGQGASGLKTGLDRLFSAKPFKRFVAGLIVGWAKTLVKNRENLRFERTRIFGRARHLFRAVGRQFFAHGLLEDADDIYFLSVSEVLGVIEGFTVSADIAPLAALRKGEMEEAGERPDPEERIVVRGAAFRRSGATASVKPVPPSDATSQTGTGCSAGKVTAVARIVRDPRKQSINRGEILVARHTDPGWIAVFCNASAIVVERGSLLSHSAIVARELGIPCVVGLKGAMDWIVDGETIEVDGATGVVRRLS